jgi:hypothetical protein
LGTYLDERLDLAPLGPRLLSHSFCHLLGTTLDTSDNGMRELPILCALVILFDNNGLLSGMASLEDDNDLRDMVKFSEFRFELIAPTFPGL